MGAGRRRRRKRWRRRKGVFSKKEKPTQNRQNSSRLFLPLQMYINAGEVGGGASGWGKRKRRQSF